MTAKISLVDKRFGMLVVLEELPRRPGDKQVRYSCRCDCGTIIETDAACLRGGKKSCGCLRSRNKELRLKREEEKRESRMLTKERLKSQKFNVICPHPSSRCNLSKAGLCCTDCDQNAFCDEACKNMPQSCGCCS